MKNAVSICFVLLAIGTIFVAFSPSVPAQTVPGSSKISDADVRFLCEGVEGIPKGGAVPGPVCVFGENATSVIDGKYGEGRATLLAAAKFGKGRVLAFGHGTYLTKDMISSSPDCLRLIQNGLEWLGNHQKPLRIAVIGNPGLAEHLATLGYEADALTGMNDPAAKGKYRLLAVDAGKISDDQIPRISNFVSNGGGLLTASLGWGWLQVSGKTDLKTEHDGNRLLAPMGVVWSDGYLGTTMEKDGVPLFKVGDISRLLNVSEAMRLLQAHEKDPTKLTPEEIRQALSTVEMGIQSIPDNQLSKYKMISTALEREVVPTPQHKIRKDSMIPDVLAITLQVEKYLRSQSRNGFPADGVPAFKAAGSFPGAAPDGAAVVIKKIDIDTMVPGWHSLGLYAAPGQTITVRIPKDHMARKGRAPLKARIGCHADRIWGSRDWSRYPEITLEVPLKTEETRLANPFGGLVYVTVPNQYGGETVTVEIAGCMESPLFVLGKTSLDDWKKTIRETPGPWGELASDRLVLSLPSEHLRKLDDPDAVMEFWNNVLDCCAEFAAWPPGRERPERIVCDRQISAGYMHSGYPVMTHMDVEPYFVTLKDNPDKGWGFFHEFGHNHQSGDWTFAGAGEVTVNLFTLYVFERLFQRDANRARNDKYSPEERRLKREKYFAEGSPFDQWKNDPFLALIMYVDLQQEFGWEAFTKTFKEYRELKSEERPRNDDEKRDQWMVRFSRMVGRNLGPYFKQWGIPVSQTALDSIKNLPSWDPYKKGDDSRR